MIVAIHQPNFIPWLGYFYKIAHADVFVFLDSAQFTRNSYINRNRIKTQSGPQWLTVPVRTTGRFGQSILEVKMAWESDWRQKHMNALTTNYGRAPFFPQVLALLERSYSVVGSGSGLAEFNISLIEAVCAYLDIKREFVRASNLALEGQSTDLLVRICQELGATTYLAGGGAVNYQDDAMFKAAGVEVEYSDFKRQPYPQLWGDFLPNLSIVDALMNKGPSTLDLLVKQTQG
jgi:hypothetical protein